MQSVFERAGVQSFWEAFKRIEGFLNKTEERLAKLGGIGDLSPQRIRDNFYIARCHRPYKF